MQRDDLNEAVNGLCLTAECPKCKGEGTIRDPSVRINPNQDSGAFGIIGMSCDLCDGKGRVKLKKLKFESS